MSSWTSELEKTTSPTNFTRALRYGGPLYVDDVDSASV